MGEQQERELNEMRLLDAILPIAVNMRTYEIVIIQVTRSEEEGYGKVPSHRNL